MSRTIKYEINGRDITEEENSGNEVACASPCYPKIGDRLYYTYEPRGGEVLAIFTKENKA